MIIIGENRLSNTYTIVNLSAVCNGSSVLYSRVQTPAHYVGNFHTYLARTYTIKMVRTLDTQCLTNEPRNVDSLFSIESKATNCIRKNKAKFSCLAHPPPRMVFVSPPGGRVIRHINFLSHILFSYC